MPWAMIGVILTISLLVGTWLLRNRAKAWLGEAFLEGARAWVWLPQEDGSVRLNPEIPKVIEAALLALAPKEKRPQPQIEGLGPLGALIPRKYAWIAALAAPILQQYLGKGGGITMESSGGSGEWK